MAANTKIEWTEKTWNPTTGCDRISAGCDHCYALTMAKRLKAMGSAKYQTDGDPRTSGPGFGVATHEDTLGEPLKWRKPTKVFVNSMSDLFHAKVPREFVARVFAVMAATPQHTYQILTKRPERMARMLGSDAFRAEVQQQFDAMNIGRQWRGHEGTITWPLPGVWLGTSIESAEHIGRGDALRETPAAVRFISAEPLLGPLDGLDLRSIDWLIAGGESGTGARPMSPMWLRYLRDRCVAAGVPFFLKQWGEWGWDGSGGIGWFEYPDRLVGPELMPFQFPGHQAVMRRVGKKAAGRVLDGRTWDEYPRVIGDLPDAA